MVDGQKYGDFNGISLQILGYVFCELQVNKLLQEGQISNCTKWIKVDNRQKMVNATLQSKLGPEKGELEIISSEVVQELKTETSQLISRFQACSKNRIN